MVESGRGSPPSEPLLEARALAVEFGVGEAIEGIDFAVGPGQGVGFVAGDATPLLPLLETLAGLRPPASGEIRRPGLETFPSAKPGARRAPSPYERERAVRLRAVLVSESAPLLANATLEENLALPLVYHFDCDRAAAAERARPHIETLGLEKWLRARPADMPRGACRRGLLARALVLEPVLLLLDVPLSELDADSEAAILEVLRRFVRERGGAFVATLYKPRALASLLDVVYVLERGTHPVRIEEPSRLPPQALDDPESLRAHGVTNEA